MLSRQPIAMKTTKRLAGIQSQLLSASLFTRACRTMPHYGGVNAEPLRIGSLNSMKIQLPTKQNFARQNMIY
jgi:hypothetical protein